MTRVAISTVRLAPDDPHAWSGIPAWIVRTMRAGHAVDPVLLPPPAPRLHQAGRILSWATKRMPGDHKVNWEVEPALLRRITKSMLASAHAAAPGQPIMSVGWLPLVKPSDGARVAYYNDSVYAQRADTSPHWRGLGRHSRRRLERTEGEAMRHLAAVIMASSWAADDAIARYGLDPSRVHVVPLAANIPTPPEVDRRAPDGPIRLLATGVEWHRKGMDIAVETVDALRARDLDASLDVVGVMPPDESWRRAHVRYHGFLSKGDPVQAETLNHLYANASVFVFPTRDEPYGIVPIEAGAYSLPVVAPALNALPEIVQDGVTGILVPAGSGADAYADAIEAICRDASRYEQMGRAGRAAHVERLNWGRSVELFAEILHSI